MADRTYSELQVFKLVLLAKLYERYRSYQNNEGILGASKAFQESEKENARWWREFHDAVSQGKKVARCVQWMDTAAFAFQHCRMSPEKYVEMIDAIFLPPATP